MRVDVHTNIRMNKLEVGTYIQINERKKGTCLRTCNFKYIYTELRNLEEPIGTGFLGRIGDKV